MASLQEQELKLKRLQRLRLLQKVNSHAPLPVSEQTLLTSLLRDDSELGFTKNIIRQHLDYMDELSFIQTENVDDVWAAKVRPWGTDYLDGLGEDVPGIARPTEL